jgi:TRAP-type C4-dicarboxylate transport system substrate-binding protein
MRSLSRWAVLLAAALAAAAMAQENRLASSQSLKLSTAQGPAYPLGKAGDIWATLIRERSRGRLDVAYFPGAVLSSRDPAREFGALRDGTFELAVGSTLAWSAQVPQLNVIALPWLVPDEQALQALIDGGTGKRLAAVLEGAGVVAVAWAANGFLEIASKAPLHQPADLGGARVRTQGSPLLEETLAALGARPSAMNIADARAALENGQLDGQETSIAGYAVSRLQAGPLNHLQVWHAHADALVFGVNRSTWQAWSDADRQLVREAAVDASRQARAMAERLSGDNALTALGAQAVRVTRLTPAGRAAFRQAARAVYERWTPVIGSELVEGAEADIAAGAARR